MWEFLTAGGPVMFVLLILSIIGLAFIIERGLALRWERVIPAEIEEAVEQCREPRDLPRVMQACEARPSPMAAVLQLARQHLHWPKQENMDSIETRARHEVVKLSRGLVVLEITVGIAPLTGLVGTLHGLIALFATLGATGMTDNAAVAKGISIALNTTLMGLVVAIPALIAWSYYNNKVENLAAEMENLTDQFLRTQYREKLEKA